MKSINSPLLTHLAALDALIVTKKTNIPREAATPLPANHTPNELAPPNFKIGRAVPGWQAAQSANSNSNKKELHFSLHFLRSDNQKKIFRKNAITPESPLVPPADQEASDLWIRDWCSLCCSALRLKNSERKPCLEKNLTAQKNAKTYYKSVEFNQFVDYLNERTKPNPAFCHHMFPFEFYLRVFGRLSHTCARTGSLPAD